ncbi:cellobiose dehydrogenase [Dendrothele bispora CBS 962.96]|uniref:Cellobiose dehydrogenase n=1 Tax=Dendrothele bispora (strain CBS 962.96) TaxID=1314807 RepID=A0A4S8LW37_DENBC|nr:cellobiose dehydrogenase [Dendrothele bispora CBS 962.96]
MRPFSNPIPGSAFLLAASAVAKTYDTIVVGGGPSGIIVAERLAEAGESVLLIERGPASTYASGGNRTMPWNDTATIFDVPSMAYQLYGLEDQSEFCTDTPGTAGCLLGGGTSVNALVFVHPQPIDFDDKWPTHFKWDDVRDAADRLYERNPGTSLPLSDGVRYDTGVWDVMSAFLANNSWKEVDTLTDPSDKYQVYAHPPWNIKDSVRAGPVLTYLPLAEQMENFELTLETQVLRVVRDSDKATGVEVQYLNGSGEVFEVGNDGKIVLAAGALTTPKILVQSAIGPVDQIETVQNGTMNITIPENKDQWITSAIRVGVKDHIIFTINLETTKTSIPAYNFSNLFTSEANATDVEMYNTEGAGIFAQGGQRINFWSSLNGTDGQRRFFQGTTTPNGENGITIKLYLTHGLTSKGTLIVNRNSTTSFSEKPYLTTDADKEAVIAFIDSLKEMINKQDDIVLNSKIANLTSAEMIESYSSATHFVGTAKMGTCGEEDVVVDVNTKVCGMENLYVVDASIHADLPTGNTQAIVMIVAEKQLREFSSR